MLEMIWPHIQDFDTDSTKDLDKEESGSCSGGSGSEDGSKEDDSTAANEAF